MVLVRLRCKRCGRVLRKLDDTFRPEPWVSFARCRRCDLTPPDRVARVLLQKGMDSMALTAAVDWNELRPHYERALRDRRTVDVLT